MGYLSSPSQSKIKRVYLAYKCAKVLTVNILFLIFYFFLWKLHALSCCLKAICTADAARAIDECRRACGGHGFMTSSSLPTIYGMVTAAETYEGENTVLLLQTARYYFYKNYSFKWSSVINVICLIILLAYRFLMKAWQKVIDHQPLAPTVKYLERHSERRLPWTNDLTSLITAYEQVAMG